jgi:pimeloyl-ACP methyl ester carboxylesterase
MRLVGGTEGLFNGGHSTTVHSPDQLSARLAAADIPIHLDVGERDGLFPTEEELAESLRPQGANVRWNPAGG